jgi:hypothetical protein
MVTPPVPSFSSGHTVEGTAAARAMSRFFGSDEMRFSTCSMTLPAGSTCADGAGAVERSFTTFRQAAEENAISRVYAGIHFRRDIEAGFEQGRRIADLVVNQVMRPVG